MAAAAGLLAAACAVPLDSGSALSKKANETDDATCRNYGLRVGAQAYYDCRDELAEKRRKQRRYGY